MLATTAARTGGVCMACKQGIRQQIEAGKAYYRKQREPDSFRDYWTNLVRRVHTAPDGFYRLSSVEQIYYAVVVLRGEVYNGGMHQFFFNSDFYEEALNGLQTLGASRSRELLLAAREELFPNGNPPRDTATRRATLPEPFSALETIDKEFWKDPDGLDERLRKFALENRLVRMETI
jgi:hypothetical protein